MRYIRLGRSDIRISPVGVGTWAWGEKLWGYGGTYRIDSLWKAFKLAVDNGINFFDTAEIYGGGLSEILLGKFEKRLGVKIVIASKFWPTRISKRGVVGALKASLRRFKRNYLDLYYVHWPNPIASMRIWSKALLDLYHSGKIKSIGVSNFSFRGMLKFDELLGGNLSANQVKLSMLEIKAKKALLLTCLKRGITLVAYSPLAQGALTGKYTESNLPMELARCWNPVFTRKNMIRIKPLLELLKRIAEKHGVSPVNVALRYLIDRGAVPLVGVRRPEHVESLLQTFDLNLKTSDKAALERTLKKVKISTIGALGELAARVVQCYLYSRRIYI